jgi:flagellar basal body rod protein FlgG
MGAMTQASQHGQVANNLANTDTPGFKPAYATFKEVLAESLLQPGWRPEINEKLVKTGGGVWMNADQTAFLAGPLRETGNPLNAAIIDTNGFFEVLKGDQKYLTRDGSFTLDAEGNLTMSDGHSLVLDEGGNPINLKGHEGLITIGTDGTIKNEESGDILGKLSLVTADDLTKVEKIGDNLFDPSKAEMTPAALTVNSGTIEGSAVNPIREMVAMIEATRAYQANMKFITIQDETLGRTVSTVGSVR